MSILKTVTTSLAWLAGSLAAISAVMGTCGFMVIRSQSYLLGLGDFLQFSTHRYVLEGAQFLLYTLIVANDSILHVVALLLLVLGIPLFILAKSRWITALCAKWREKWKSRFQYAWLPTLAAATILICLFFFRLIPYLEDFKTPLAVNHLLVRATPAAPADACHSEILTGECIASQITHGSKEQLKHIYFQLLLHYMEALLIFFLVWRFSLHWPHKLLIYLPFVSMLLAFTLLLPMCYGVLVKPVELSPLKLDFKNGAAQPAAQHLYLLQKTANAFIAWNHDQRAIVWYPSHLVDAAVVRHRQPLFQAQPEPQGGQP